MNETLLANLLAIPVAVFGVGLLIVLFWKPFRCNRCGKKKVGVLAKWFGLHHCEDCDLQRFRVYATALVEARLKAFDKRLGVDEE